MRRSIYLMIIGALIAATIGTAASATSGNEPLRADDLRLVSAEDIEVELVINDRTGETAMIPAIRAVYEPKEPQPVNVALGSSQVILAFGGNCQAIWTVPDPYVSEDYWGNDRATAYASLEVTSACSTGVFWRHEIQEKQWGIGWIRRGAAYTNTVAPGTEDYDIRSDGCSSSTNEDWKNDTNVVDNQRNIACDN